MEVKSRVPGKVDAVNFKAGDTVKSGDVIVVLEAMKMKSPVPVQQDGTIKEVKVAVGDRVNAGSVLFVVE